MFFYCQICKFVTFKLPSSSWLLLRELKQPRRRRQQKPLKFAYLTMKNSILARFARAFSIFWHFEDVLVLSTTWNDLFCSCVDDVSIWWQIFNFVFLCPKRWFRFNSRMVRTHFSSVMTLNNWKMIEETRSYIFRWRSRFRRRCVCLSSLLSSLISPLALQMNKRNYYTSLTMKFPMTTAGMKNGIAAPGLVALMQSHRGSIHSPHNTLNTIMKACQKSLKFHRGTPSSPKASGV